MAAPWLEGLLTLAAGGSAMVVLLRLGRRQRGGEARRRRRSGRGRRSQGALAGLLFGAADELGVSRIVVALLSLGAMTLSAMFVWSLSGWPALALVSGCCGLLVPRQVLGGRARRRRLAFEDALLTAVEQLRALIRGGHSIETALVVMSERAPAAARGLFRELVRDTRNVGLERALRRRQEEVANPLFDAVAEALAASYGAGGGRLGELIQEIATDTRRAAKLAGEQRAQAGGRLRTMRLLALAPLGMLGIYALLNRPLLAAFDSLAGQLVLLLALGLSGCGYLTMLFLAREQGAPRLTGDPTGSAGPLSGRR